MRVPRTSIGGGRGARSLAGPACGSTRLRLPAGVDGRGRSTGMAVSGRVRARGAAVTALALAVALAALSAVASGEPRFRPDGPDAEAFGRSQGYPPCQGLDYVREQRCRIGAFSQFDTLYPARTVKASGAPVPLARAPSEPPVVYALEGQRLTLDQYLERHPVTGLLIAQGDTILAERYQYGRNDTQRLTSFSMAKTIVGLLIGVALEEGAIRSVDDPAEAYVPGLTGTEYGRTPIRALLQMASGVAFREVYTDMQSDIATLALATLGQAPGGSLAVLPRFNTRQAPPGQRFSYSSAESTVLGLVLAGATRRTVSDHASAKLWQPLGAEADATWCIDASGQEITFAYYNAVLRDWARLGLMLAADGAWAGRRIVPRAWLREATTSTPQSPSPGYGYHVWLHPSAGRSFSLRGLRGQVVLVDPDRRRVLVQTAARAGMDRVADQELFALWLALRAQQGGARPSP